MRRMSLIMLLAILAVLALSACDEGVTSTTETDQSGPLGLFEWERDPNTIIVRLDNQPVDENQAFLLNSIPPCTVWGDGRAVWVTQNETGAEEVLKTRIDEVTMRAFLEDIINRGFYTWESEIVPPSAPDAIVESITVVLYDEVRTVQNHTVWPQNAFTHILEDCQGFMNDTTRVVLPGVDPEPGGWVTAFPIERDPMAPNWFWPPDAPFSLSELVSNANDLQMRWVEGPVASEIWLSAREARGDIQVIEGQNAYQVAIVVPGISRDAPPSPGEAEPEPTPSP